jgi:ArsR family transcriptional regulator
MLPTDPHLDTTCAEKLKILSDPTRLSAIELLMSGPRRVGELAEALSVEQSLLSHHLRVLRDAGFVATRRDGRGVLYDLSPQCRSSRAATLDLGCCAISFEPGDT